MPPWGDSAGAPATETPEQAKIRANLAGGARQRGPEDNGEVRRRPRTPPGRTDPTRARTLTWLRRGPRRRRRPPQRPTPPRAAPGQVHDVPARPAVHGHDRASHKTREKWTEHAASRRSRVTAEAFDRTGSRRKLGPGRETETGASKQQHSRWRPPRESSNMAGT